MPTERITIPEELLHLKPLDDLECVPISALARKGTAVIQSLLETGKPVVISLHGQPAMVAVSKRQYDAVFELIHQIERNEDDDGFLQSLADRFDRLVVEMKKPGAGQAIEEALFGDTESLNESHRLGSTETKN